MYCVKCGQKLLKGARFCTSCGTKIEYNIEKQNKETVVEKETERSVEEMVEKPVGEKVEEVIEESEEKVEEIIEEPVEEKNEETMEKPEEKVEEIVEEPEAESVETELAIQNVGIIETKELPGNEFVIVPDVEQAKSMAKKSKKLWIIVAVLLLFCGGIGGLCFVLYQNTIKWNNWVAKYEKSMKEYYMSEEEQEDYNDYVQQAKETKDNGSRGTIKNRLEKLQKTVKEENEAYIKELDANVRKIENDYDLTYALEDELTEIAETKKQYEELRQAHNYPEAISKTEYCMELQAAAAVIREGWQVDIQQKDVSEFPTVKLYFTIEDEAGNAVVNLNKNMFFLSQKDAENGEYLKHEITNATQLNENESLNINLVADVSGSMSGNMGATKSVMNNFLNTVQFGVGDQVGLIAFDDVSYGLADFTDNKSTLTSAVNGMSLGGMTKLYDTLIEAVQKVLPQRGAKCVIAFTDGYDNRSASSIQDVIDYANMYQVPIFIIGIGDDVETDNLRNIANSTGGFYKSVDYVDDSFEDIYAEIYRAQKEIYCLEYVVDSDNMNDEQDISIYVRNADNGGQVTCQYTASYDYFGILLQEHLTAYLGALEAGDYSLMEQAGFMSPDGGIAKEMKAYIKNNQETLDEQLLSCMVTDTEYVDKDTYIVKSEEVYDIYQERNYIKDMKKSKLDDEKAAIRYMEENGYDMEKLEEEDLDVSIHKTRTLKGHYVIKRSTEGKWQFADYKSNFEVLDSEVYTAYPMD